MQICYVTDIRSFVAVRVRGGLGAGRGVRSSSLSFTPMTCKCGAFSVLCSCIDVYSVSLSVRAQLSLRTSRDSHVRRQDVSPSPRAAAAAAAVPALFFFEKCLAFPVPSAVDMYCPIRLLAPRWCTCASLPMPSLRAF